MNSATANSSTAKKREWWRREAARLGSDWNGVMELRISVAPLECGICGAVPCATPSFCTACRLADQQQPRLAQREIKQRPTPQTTIEAILYCVKARGQSPLQESANVERLSRCDAAALAQIAARMAKLGLGRPVARWPEFQRLQLSSPSRRPSRRIIVPDDHALMRLVRRIAEAQAGERTQLTYWAACRVGEMVASGLLDAHDAAAVIAEAATRAGLPRSEAERTAWSGIRRTGRLANA